MKKNITVIESIENKIFNIRGKSVMSDSHLAELYQVETFNLNKAVKRNIERFPEEFMFQLTKEEYQSLRSQFTVSDLKFQNGISSWGGRRTLPYMFTEHGVTMLASVLNSKRAIQINIQIIKAFVAMRRYALEADKHLPARVGILERTLLSYMDKNDKRADEIIAVLNKMLEAENQETKKIGFIP